MDETVRFGPDRRLTALIALGCLLAVGFAVATSDGPGRLLFAVAAVIAGCYVVGDLVFPARITANATGLRIRSPLARTDLAWHEIEHVRADVRLRLGLRSTALEVDAGQTLVVFSRRALGAEPAVVAGAVRAAAPPAWQ